MIAKARGFFSDLAGAARWRLAGALALMFVFSLTEGFGILLLFPTLQAAGMDLVGQGEARHYAKLITGTFAAVGIRPSLAALLLVFVTLMGARATLGRWQTVAGLAVIQEFAFAQRLRLYRAIANASWLHVCRNRASTFTHALTAETERSTLAGFYLMWLLGDAIVTGLYVAIGLRLSIGMTALVLTSGALLATMLRGRTRSIEESGFEISGAAASFYAAMTEHLHNLKTTRAYGAEERNIALFARLTNELKSADVAAEVQQASASAWFELGSAAILGAVLYVSIRWLDVQPAIILVLLVLFARVMPRLMSAYQRWSGFLVLLPSYLNLRRIEAECIEAAELPASEGPIPRFERDIRFERVSFSYDRGAPVVRSVTLEIPAGAIVAIVGPSGAGKSTVADLAMGLITPDDGTILIDDLPLTRYNARAWREAVGYVAPDTFLFHDTIRANLEWARPGASEAEIREALAIAAADQFVAALPAGLETVVGDRGVVLSQGERQRLALARAILRRPRLLVLDEATNNLDSVSEARVLESLGRLHSNAAVILIAHRISTVRWADFIYVIEEGRVVESGDWSALSSRPAGRFRALCEAQEVGA